MSLRIIIALLLLIAVPVFAQEQVCYSQAEPAFPCDGQPRGHVQNLPSWAESPAPIVRASVTYLGADVPLHTINGNIGVYLDPGAAFTNASTLTQQRNFARVITLANVQMYQHQPLSVTQTFMPPVMMRLGDVLWVDEGCVGGGWVAMGWTVCWIKP